MQRVWGVFNFNGRVFLFNGSYTSKEFSFICCFLTNENKNGILLDNKFNLKEYRRVFDERNELSIETLKGMSEKCYKSAIESLLYASFEKKCIDVYTEMTENIL